MHQIDALGVGGGAVMGRPEDEGGLLVVGVVGLCEDFEIKRGQALGADIAADIIADGGRHGGLGLGDGDGGGGSKGEGEGEQQGSEAEEAHGGGAGLGWGEQN